MLYDCCCSSIAADQTYAKTQPTKILCLMTNAHGQDKDRREAYVAITTSAYHTRNPSVLIHLISPANKNVS